MKFRTITVTNSDGEPLNAVLLCGFSATGADRKYVVYSLNEKLDGGLARIYVASLYDDQNDLLMACVSPIDFKMAAQTLKSIISDALASASGMSDGCYQILDLLDARIIPGDVHTHRSLKVNEAWVEKLLNFQPSAGPFIQTTMETSTRDIHIELECTDYYSKLTLLNQYEDNNRQAPSPPLNKSSRNELAASPTSVMTNVAPTISLEASEETDPMTQNTVSRIEQSLQTLMTNLSNHKEALQSKHEEIYSARLEQERLDRDLTIREAMLDQREEELSKSAASLIIAEAQLSELIHLINDASPVTAPSPASSNSDS
jgi:regulator of replication initiation timing